jgi:hypothetical protein
MGNQLYYFAGPGRGNKKNKSGFLSFEAVAAGRLLHPLRG